MSRSLASRLPFLFAVALVAAGLSDPVVESMSNTGIFGRYVDNNHLGVVPALLAGTVVIAEVLLLRFVAVWRHSTSRSRGSLIDVAKDFGSGSVARDFPLIFGLQLLAIFFMESGEQFIAEGKVLGGTAWLGGPVFVSLLLHAAVGGICTVVLGGCMRAIVRTFASLVLSAVRFIWLTAVRAISGSFHLDRAASAVARTQAPHVRQIGGRAPPLLSTPA